jgi:hypothetical protein
VGTTVEEAAMAEENADKVDQRQWDRAQEAKSRELSVHVVDQTRIAVDASRGILHFVLPDHLGAEATAVADAFDSLQVTLTRLQESLSR